LGVDGKLVERRTRDVYFDDQIRRWIHIQAYPGLAPDVLLVLNIEKQASGSKLRSRSSRLNVVEPTP